MGRNLSGDDRSRELSVRSELANLFVVAVAGGASTRVTHWAGYDGAPAWSPDGLELAFESYAGDPDESPGTTLCLIDAPP